MDIKTISLRIIEEHRNGKPMSTLVVNNYNKYNSIVEVINNLTFEQVKRLFIEIDIDIIEYIKTSNTI